MQVLLVIPFFVVVIVACFVLFSFVFFALLLLLTRPSRLTQTRTVQGYAVKEERPRLFCGKGATFVKLVG